MKIEEIEGASYLIGKDASGVVRLHQNEAASRLMAAQSVIETALDKLADARAGAIIAGLLISEPWIESFQIELSPDSVSGDEGDYFRSVSLRIEKVVAREGAGIELPEEVLDGNGLFDADYAEDHLQIILSDEENELDEAFCDPSDFSDVVVDVSRAPIADLLDGPDGLDGMVVYARMFGANSDRVRFAEVGRDTSANGAPRG